MKSKRKMNRKLSSWKNKILKIWLIFYSLYIGFKTYNEVLNSINTTEPPTKKDDSWGILLLFLLLFSLQAYVLLLVLC